MVSSSVTLYIASSLDGFIATEDGGVTWLDEFDDHYENGVDGGSYEDFFAGIDCLVMGSYTYEQILSFGDWPYGEKPTTVLTHRGLSRQNEHIEFYSGDLPELTRELKDTYDDIWLVGGAKLAQEFLRSNLIDEIRLSIIPVLLGSGISLFDDAGTEYDLHLEDVTAYETGITELQYAVISY